MNENGLQDQKPHIKERDEVMQRSQMEIGAAFYEKGCV